VFWYFHGGEFGASSSFLKSDVFYFLQLKTLTTASHAFIFSGKGIPR
jgi:hypothetical protein